jgi:hypothetical protein
LGQSISAVGVPVMIQRPVDQYEKGVEILFHRHGHRRRDKIPVFVSNAFP